MTTPRWIVLCERFCVVVFLAWLVWIPLPFGSVVPRARLPLIAVPMTLCIAAALLRLYSTRDRFRSAQPTLAWSVWGFGSLAFLLVGALQLVPLGAPLLRVVSEQSHEIWTAANRVASLAGVTTSAVHPVSIDPRATTVELLRLGGVFAAFSIAALMLRTQTRRLWLAAVLCSAGVFESMYGLREAALQRYEIWGWSNRLIFNRVTGTFVNPNHFAHYLAIVLPMAFFIIASAWRTSAPPDLPFLRRVLAVAERAPLQSGFAVLAGAACLAGMLLAQSRGALLALTSGVLVVAAIVPGRRVVRVALSVTAAVVVLIGLTLFLGTERTVGRFMPNEFEQQTLVGRKIGIAAALRIWNRFPLLGSGLGTFERVVSLEQRQDLEKIYHHAHNDYAEIMATTGALGFTVALVALIGGYVALVRMTFGRTANDLAWRRRAFQVAALTSLTIAAMHALFDFNLFIPSNPATLAAIAGAAVATTDHDRRRGSNHAQPA